MRWISFILSFILYLGIALPSHAQSASSALTDLERAAVKMLESGKPEEAIGIYQQYERQMVEEGWATLQPDLLRNLAIAHYRAGNLGEAMANLKQLNILVQSPKVEGEIQDLQMLIEHRVYQEAPNTAFVRGQSSDYIFWETLHRFSPLTLDIAFFVVWTLLFIFLGISLAISATKKNRKLSVILIGIWGVFVLNLGAFTYQHRLTDHKLFGVILQTSSLRHDPGYDAPLIEDPAFVPGMTVSVISSVEGWLKIERADGTTSWIDVNDFYLLRGVGSQRSSRLQAEGKK